ncbi:TPA: hypothetical protein ACHKE7_004954, partial [Escherichia coli]
ISKAKDAPQSRIFKYQTPHESSLTIVRDKGLVGSACNASIFINGETAAKLEPGEKATFYLNEGEWIVGTSIESSGLCAFNPSRMEREIKLKQGDSKTYRVFTTWDGTMDILPTTL